LAETEAVRELKGSNKVSFEQLDHDLSPPKIKHAFGDNEQESIKLVDK